MTDMNVPKDSPIGLAVRRNVYGGIQLIVNDLRPRWKFWRTGTITLPLDQHGMIWLYQACAKFAREDVLPNGFNELLFDLRSAHQAVTGADIDDGYPLDSSEAEKIADLLLQKGWMKR